MIGLIKQAATALDSSVRLEEFRGPYVSLGPDCNLAIVWARVGNQPVGMGVLTMRPADGRNRISDIRTKKEFEGKGIARAIVTRLVEIADAELPGENIYARVGPYGQQTVSVEGLQKFYAKFGFKPAPALDRVYGHFYSKDRSYIPYGYAIRDMVREASNDSRD